MPVPQQDMSVVDDEPPPPKSLRIALVTETYPPEVNGVAATVARVVLGLRARGHAVQLVRPRQAHDRVEADAGADAAAAVRVGLRHGARTIAAANPQRTADDADAGTDARCRATDADVLMRGLPIPRYPQLRMGLPAGRALQQLWADQRPDVVHIATEGPLGWSALRAAMRLKVPVVSDFRTNFHAYSRHYGVGWLGAPVMRYLRHFHNRTACTMVPTDGLRSELAAAGFDRLRVVARGVDNTLFDPARRSETLRRAWGAGRGTVVALCVGRLAREKNMGAVLAAYDAMRDAHPRVRLVLVGDGPDKTRLIQQCPTAHFAGSRSGDDLAAHYASADVFLFPSVTETFGNVVPEAMASGLAVVAYDHAAAGQLVRHGNSGLLARLDDTAGFCSMARRLAGDPAHARALGLQARVVANGLGWDRIVDAIEGEYVAAMPRETVGRTMGTGAVAAQLGTA